MPLAVCATPIGNLDDVTLRVLEELRSADVVLCEDTRHTRVLLQRHGIAARLLSYHEHNEAARTAELLPRLLAGERMALASDAGLPGINDPGARLIAAALEAGVGVTVLPGASAVETALVASGLVGERYQFLGYLPRGEKALSDLWAGLAAWPHPAVAFESPKRLPKSLASLARAMPDRPVAVCRELTKRVRRGRPRQRRRGRGTLPRAAEGRDHPRAGRSRGDCGGRRRRGRGRRLGARRRRPAPATRSGCRGTAHRPASQPPLQRLSVARIDNGKTGCYRARSVYNQDNTEVAVRRIALLAASFLLLAVPGARAWTWPAGGEVLRPFVFDPTHPYAGGQHRGIDVSAAPGESILAPAAGSISFAGTVPGGGPTLTILTPDGYAVTLLHLGSLAVARGAAVAEGQTVGAAGDGGSVYLGVRLASDPQGYVDPLAFLPVRATPTSAPPAAAPAPAPAPRLRRFRRRIQRRLLRRIRRRPPT